MKAGVELGLYISPIHWLDLAASYKSAQPVNDGINAILLGYTQNVGSGSVTARLGRGISAFTRGSYARYSDENDRWNGVGGVQYYSPWPWLKRVALEYEILQFANRTGVYSSPEDDRFLRPVIDFAPALNDWASLDLHVEIPYVFNDEEWGHGIRAGVRFQWADCSLGVAYLNYQIPGGQTIWSGEGFNIDLQCKF